MLILKKWDIILLPIMFGTLLMIHAENAPGILKEIRENMKLRAFLNSFSNFKYIIGKIAL
jgi:hypothetical protein